MRILCAILADMYYNPNIHSLEWATFWPACRKLGVARLFPYWREERNRGCQGMNDYFLQVVGEFQPDVVFTVPWHDNWLPGTMESVPVPTVAWFSDSYRQDYIRQEAPHYSHCVAMDARAEAIIREAGKPVFRSMWACNPDMHRTYGERVIDVIWAGLNQKDREPYIREMVNAFRSLNAVVRSNTGFTEPLVDPTDYARLHGQAKIGISLSLNVRGEVQPKTRPFEVAGCGPMLLASKPNTLEGYFVEGKEYVGFESINDMVEKVYYYLDHQEGRRAIAHAGQTRAHKEHTYERRLREVFKWVCGTSQLA